MGQVRYNGSKMKRKPRTDRNHLIYSITNVVTSEVYIGLTVIRKGNVKKSMDIRWLGHQYKAFVERKNTTMSKSLRKYGAESFEMEALWIVRGKTEAHAFERELVAKKKPALNILCK